MQKNILFLILWLALSAVGIALFTFFVARGAVIGSLSLLIIGIVGLIISAASTVWAIIWHFKTSQQPALVAEPQEQEPTPEQTLVRSMPKLLEQCAAIKDDEFNEVGYVSFVNEGIKFSATARYGCVKDFNGKPGYHLAFEIRGLEMVEQPNDYEDVIGYEDVLFLIDLGYFDGSLLSDDTNENGIIVSDLDNLEGKTVTVNAQSGYTACIYTAECDDIHTGEVKFVEWNEKSKIIKFKLLVDYGLCDIVVGTVALNEDDGVNEE